MAPTARRGFRVYKGASKLKVLASRETFISMESLVSGTATRVVGLWLFRMLKAQWDDFVEARRKLARAKRKAQESS